MPHPSSLLLSCPIHESFRVHQVAGMFDVPLAERATETIHYEPPDMTTPWEIGLIVGPSASGKTTIARELFGDALVLPKPWPTNRAVVDCLGDIPTREITKLFTTIGFSSPPAWIKPYQALSNGEKFRCEVARAFASTLNPQSSILNPPLIAIDEFTSLLDRRAAKLASAALAKAIRAQRLNCKFVAITCHHDIAPWLNPDWTLDMATGLSSSGLRPQASGLPRRRLRRPRIKLEITRAPRDVWSSFSRHHYLSANLPAAARCHVASWQQDPVAFCATIPCIGRRNHWRITRLVTLPDFQGLGIGTKLAAAIARLHHQQGHRLNITTSHPAMIHHCAKSPNWKTISIRRGGKRPGPKFTNYQAANGRAVVSFEFVCNP